MKTSNLGSVASPRLTITLDEIAMSLGQNKEMNTLNFSCKY